MQYNLMRQAIIGLPKTCSGVKLFDTEFKTHITNILSEGGYKKI